MTRDLRVHMRAPGAANHDGITRISFDLVGDDQVSGGVGGWKEVAREKRRPVLVFEKTPLRTYKLPLRIGDLVDDKSIEAECRTLFRWGQFQRKGEKMWDPPKVIISGNVRIQTGSVKRWVISGLDWGTYHTRESGARIQQDVTVTLTEWVDLTAKGWAAILANN